MAADTSGGAASNSKAREFASRWRQPEYKAGLLGDFLPEIAALLPRLAWVTRGLAIFSSAALLAFLTLMNRMSFLSRLAELGLLSILYTAAVVVAKAWTKILEHEHAVEEALRHTRQQLETVSRELLDQ